MMQAAKRALHGEENAVHLLKTLHAVHLTKTLRAVHLTKTLRAVHSTLHTFGVLSLSNDVQQKRKKIHTQHPGN